MPNAHKHLPGHCNHYFQLEILPHLRVKCVKLRAVTFFCSLCSPCALDTRYSDESVRVSNLIRFDFLVALVIPWIETAPRDEMFSTRKRIYVGAYLGKDCQGGTLTYTWDCLKFFSSVPQTPYCRFPAFFQCICSCYPPIWQILQHIVQACLFQRRKRHL